MPHRKPSSPVDRASPETRPFAQQDTPHDSPRETHVDERPRPHRSETEERNAAWERGRRARQQRAQGQHPESQRDIPIVAQGPFAALAENVRDYAIFLLDVDGVITYWGEGARLMKWWSFDEAEGAHLRLLYMEGGSEDGTAEDHLRQAVEKGEYLGEGQRVRADGSTFWAGITLTALHDHNNVHLGFAKVTRDLTARLAVEAALAMAGSVREERDAALEQLRQAFLARDESHEAAQFAFEQARSARDFIQNVLEPELASLRLERAEMVRRLRNQDAT